MAIAIPTIEQAPARSWNEVNPWLVAIAVDDQSDDALKSRDVRAADVSGIHLG